MTFDIHPSNDHMTVRFQTPSGPVDGLALTLAGAFWVCKYGRPPGATGAVIYDEDMVPFEVVSFRQAVVARAGRGARRAAVAEVAKARVRA